MNSEKTKSQENVDEFIPVGHVDEVPDGRGRVVRIEGKRVALFNISGRFYAMNDVCPHQGASLAKGKVKRHVVSCPWHHMQFDVRNGFSADGGGSCLATYSIRVKDDQIFVSLRRQEF
jgi:nitrite reductase (NADH) small subunit